MVYRLEAIFPIECEISLLKLAVELLPNTTVEEERFLHVNKLDETRQDTSLTIEAHKRRVKAPTGSKNRYFLLSVELKEDSTYNLF